MAFITVSSVINRVKSRLGTTIRELELTDEALTEILKEETLKTLSIYFPKDEYVELDPLTDQVPDKPSLFFMRSPNDIIGVSEIPSLQPNARFLNTSAPCAVTTHAARSNVFDRIRVPYTVHFQPPNVVQVRPEPPNQKLYIKVRVAHNDFSTFNPGLRELIMNLAESDIKIAILSNRKFFQNVSVTFADVELDLGSLEEGASRRETIIEKIESKIHLTANKKKMFFD